MIWGYPYFRKPPHLLLDSSDNEIGTHNIVTMMIPIILIALGWYGKLWMCLQCLEGSMNISFFSWLPPWESRTFLMRWCTDDHCWWLFYLDQYFQMTRAIQCWNFRNEFWVSDLKKNFDQDDDTATPSRTETVFFWCIIAEAMRLWAERRCLPLWRIPRGVVFACPCVFGDTSISKCHSSKFDADFIDFRWLLFQLLMAAFDPFVDEIRWLAKLPRLDAFVGFISIPVSLIMSHDKHQTYPYLVPLYWLVTKYCSLW